ncbi:hypothetical protein EGH24_13825 [Halonotius terrestris]|uniref:Uncharacterized protein n=1 Tax=Halonotius terrestris TaxID=2487750 RepID=A0A8J8P5I3_9EURY|nr:hypothetical protein [Halonotius terrestris]TQQ78596.1 hypothetical protein EGH24_13825 [Halonotius terrestris]
MNDDGHAYTQLTTEDGHPPTAWQRVHANGEQTRVVIEPWGDAFAVIAADIDPADFEGLAAEVVAVDPTVDGAEERARRWLAANPKGVAPGQGSITGRLWSIINRLDTSAQQAGSETNE